MELLSELERTCKRNMLRYHVGQVMFCPACQVVLDCARVVEIDFYKADQLVHSAIRCVSCFEKCDSEQVAVARGLRREIQDGRILFAKSNLPRSPRVRKVPAGALVPGTVYAAKHSSGTIRFRLERVSTRKPWLNSRAVTRYIGTNLNTGRIVELKSRGAILRSETAQ